MTLLAPIIAILAGASPSTPTPTPAAEPTPTVARAPAGRGPTGGQVLDLADKEIVKVRRALTEVLSRVEDARHERDLSKLLCLDERVSQIKVLLSVAERAETALTEAIVDRDEGAAIELDKINIARAKVDLLRAEAAACIGQLAYDVGDKTDVVVEEPGDLPDTGGSPVVRSAPGADPYRTDFGIPSAAR